MLFLDDTEGCHDDLSELLVFLFEGYGEGDMVTGFDTITVEGICRVAYVAEYKIIGASGGEFGDLEKAFFIGCGGGQGGVILVGDHHDDSVEGIAFCIFHDAADGGAIDLGLKEEASA